MTELKKNPEFVLMADDDDDYSRFAALAFKEINPNIKFWRVEDGEELMDYLLRRGIYANPAEAPRPTLILLDLNMPRKNGLEALKEIKTNEELSKIPVVMLTISSNPKDVKTSYALGANSFTTKPTGFEDLLQILKTFKQYWFETVTLPEP